jgi:hypothetical protein
MYAWCMFSVLNVHVYIFQWSIHTCTEEMGSAVAVVHASVSLKVRKVNLCR